MKTKLIIILLCIFSIEVLSQKNEEILAKIGDKVITVEEFKYRYEFTPQVNRINSDQSKSKEELLYTLIAENLFSLEAEKLGIDTTLAMKMNYVPMEKMHVRDALYKKEIKDKIIIDDKKLTDGLWLANHKLFVDYVYSKEKAEIELAYLELNKSKNFDSTATLLKNVEYVKEPYEVTYGKMFEVPEKAVYGLELNEFTTPLESPDGWYIFRLLSKIQANYQSSDQKLSLVKKTVEDRTVDSIYNDFWSKFFKDAKVNTDGSLFWYFVDSMHDLVLAVKTKEEIKDKEKIELSNDELIGYKSSLNPDSLSKPFIKFDDKPITFNDFLNEFMFEGFYTFTTEKNVIANQLNSRVKRQIELELLARHGYKIGLESLDDVMRSTKIWRDNYLSTLYKRDLVFSTKSTDEEVNNYLLQKEDSLISETKVNIIEILTDSLNVVKQALAIANNDSLLKDFAVAHTKRSEVKEKGGEFGLFSISEFGEIGKIAGTMEVGDVYGPLEVEGSYSIFKVIDKQNTILNFKSDIDLQNIKANFHYNKVINKLEDNAVELADKYKVTVNESLLNKLQLNNLQLLVFRYMGFGGRTLAFPYSSPFYKWKDKWEQKKKDVL